jgi:aminocarboxymuconate-semialdehyde decarboxylase
VGRQALTAIDVHTHVTPRRFRDAVAGGGTWHGLDSGVGELEFPKFSLSASERVADMDEIGVGVQLLAPNTAFYCYDRDPSDAATIARECLAELVEMRDECPDRFAIAGTVPMPDVDVAVKELEFAMNEGGACGVMIDDHVLGTPYDEPRFRPFWEAAEDLGALLLFHQHGTLVDARTDRYALSNSVGNLVERALAFGALVFGGVMNDFPGLRPCMLHAGGYIAFGIARMDKAWRAGRDGIPGFEDACLNLERPPSSYLESFTYDCCTHTGASLRFLIDIVGLDQVVFGTDYPAKMILGDGGPGWVQALDELDAAEKTAILEENPARLLESAGKRDPEPSAT